MSVTRSKYEKAKEAATIWHEKFEDTLAKLEEELEKNDSLRTENERLRKLTDQLHDSSELDELREVNQALKRKHRELEDKFRNRIAELEREQLLDKGRIQQLEEARKDLQERYNDLKQDFREQQRWGNGKKDV